MQKHSPIIKIVLLLIIPYIILYAIYIQMHGEVSPGGGFQAGVIFATGIVAFDLINISKNSYNFALEKKLIIYGVSGVLIYASTGLISFLYDDNFLDYNSMAKNTLVKNAFTAQHIGIFLIELGVGLTVSSVLCLIYLVLKEE